MEKIIHTLSTGDPVILYDEWKSIAVKFTAPRKVLSTSLLNGAYREDFTGVFNHCCDGGANDKPCTLRAATYEAHLRVMAELIGLDPERATGMGTAADMENAAICVRSYRELNVTAIITGGVEGNGGRAGDPADYYAPGEKLGRHKTGTINIILVIDADLPPGILARALVTCTEAKTAALQELMAASLYSNGLATGSGTDQTIVVANPESPLYFEGAGKHAKLGELIGIAVKDAVKKALFRQSGLSPMMQYDMLRRWKRFGLQEDVLWQTYRDAAKIGRNVFTARLSALVKDRRLVAASSLYVHLLDQYHWGLLPPEDVGSEARQILKDVAGRFGVEPPLPVQNTSEAFIAAWRDLTLRCIEGSGC